MRDTYARLIELLDAHDAHYRLVDHPPDGATESVSAVRGHPAAYAAKCLLLTVKVDRRTRRTVLAVVPGDRRVDLDAVRRLFAARYVGFCDPDTAQRLAHAVPGTVLPFAMDDEVELIVDPAVFDAPRLWFNAARLDRSVALDTADYRRIAQPRLETISQTPL